MTSTTGHQIDARGVNHPSHYNTHPSGIETQEIRRLLNCNLSDVLKYTMRRGVKVDPALGPLESTLKDLDKALWYLNDHQQHWLPATPDNYNREARELLTKLMVSEQNSYAKLVYQGILGMVKYNHSYGAEILHTRQSLEALKAWHKSQATYPLLNVL